MFSVAEVQYAVGIVYYLHCEPGTDGHILYESQSILIKFGTLCPE